MALQWNSPLTVIMQWNPQHSEKWQWITQLNHLHNFHGWKHYSWIDCIIFISFTLKRISYFEMKNASKPHTRHALAYPWFRRSTVRWKKAILRMAVRTIFRRLSDHIRLLQHLETVFGPCLLICAVFSSFIRCSSSSPPPGIGNGIGIGIGFFFLLWGGRPPISSYGHSINGVGTMFSQQSSEAF